jgi:NADH-quinone oxidoreductase subunit L
LHQGEVINLLGWAGGQWEVEVLTLIALLLFAGAVGKSAQIPLHVWLPDAMEGPTPISALIHAATMVTAGIFMLARVHTLYDLSPLAMDVVTVVGGTTAVFAATIALTQTDIKRIVAYSTVSQLGYMTMACGLGAYAAGIFHLLTHGAFKSLLFLAAGSVIHALDGEQDLRRMGGLKSAMPLTYWTFLAGAIALAGIFPFAGFFSKDAILLRAFNGDALDRAFGWIGLLTVLMTAFYIFRLIFSVFHGQARTQAQRPHESPVVMTIPLLVLALLSIVTGWLPIPQFLSNVFVTTAEVIVPDSGMVDWEHMLWILSMLGGLAGILWAYVLYVRYPHIAASLARGFLYRLSLQKWYVDELYDRLFVRPTVNMANALWKQVDMEVIDGAVNGVADLTREWGAALRRIQSGQIQHYALYMAVGAFLMITAYLFL